MIHRLLITLLLGLGALSLQAAPTGLMTKDCNMQAESTTRRCCATDADTADTVMTPACSCSMDTPAWPPSRQVPALPYHTPPTQVPLAQPLAASRFAIALNSCIASLPDPCYAGALTHDYGVPRNVIFCSFVI